MFFMCAKYEHISWKYNLRNLKRMSMSTNDNKPTRIT